MRGLRKAYDSECERFHACLDSEITRKALTLVELVAVLPSALRAHAKSCKACHAAAHELVTSRILLQTMAAPEDEPKPWFAARVMALIAEREREFRPGTTWVAVPKLAFRLACASTVILLAGGTWLYEIRSVPASQKSADTMSESLFDSPTSPANRDDVLLSLAEVDK